MSLVFPLLLGGLLLAGIPVLLHLLMRQKPKRVPFPAVRFLMQRFRSNQRRWRLRHLLLLLLRIFVIVAICLALAQPSTSDLINRHINFRKDQAVAAVLVFDTSYSMEYSVGGKNRLEESKRRAEELLQLLPAGSQVAVLDTADRGPGQWLSSPALARDRIAALELRHANGSVTAVLPEAYRLLENTGPDQRALPRFVYVFSDRTLASWDTARLPQLREARDRLDPPANAVLVDVGVEKPINLAIANSELPRQSVSANSPAVIRVTVHTTGQPCDNVVHCRFDSEEAPDKKPVKLDADRRGVVTFDRRGLKAGLHKAELALATRDNQPFDDVRFTTFLVGEPRQVLVVTDVLDSAVVWQAALEKGESVSSCTLHSSKQPLPADLGRYQAVCLLNVNDPSPLWASLIPFVEAGGGLAVIPGGDELDRNAYNNDRAREILPGQLLTLIPPRGPPTIGWEKDSYRGALKGWFDEWERTPDIGFIRFPPRVAGYWEVKPHADGSVLVTYADGMHRPALLERTRGRGRVLLFTTPLDKDRSAFEPRWHDYLQGPVFYLPLAKRAVGHIAGDAEDARLNLLTGPVPVVTLPPAPRFNRYKLHGPGIGTTGLDILRAEEESDLPLPQAVLPGNYTLTSSDGTWSTGFSLNLPPEECDLTRVPVEDIHSLFGADAVLDLERDMSLRDALEKQSGQPIQLFSLLMILLLLALAVEGFLANPNESLVYRVVQGAVFGAMIAAVPYLVLWVLVGIVIGLVNWNIGTAIDLIVMGGWTAIFPAVAGALVGGIFGIWRRPAASAIAEPVSDAPVPEYATTAK